MALYYKSLLWKTKLKLYLAGNSKLNWNISIIFIVNFLIIIYHKYVKGMVHECECFPKYIIAETYQVVVSCRLAAVLYFILSKLLAA